MDIFVEQLVKRKRRPVDFVLAILYVIAATAVILLTLMFMRSPFTSIILLFGVGLIYLIYQLNISINVEFEYCFTNGALDVDKIIATRRRKRLTELNARNIEIMGTTNNHAFKLYMENSNIKKIYACTSIKDEGVFFVVYDRNGTKYMLLFNPNDTIKDGFRRLNPQKVFLTD